MKHKINFVFDYVFPTFILPNATMTELGIINYMTSMHSLKAQNATAFEQYISLGEMFDGQLGSMPNSGTGYFYQAQVYKNIIHYTELPLYLHQRGDSNFIYPIKPNAVLSEFAGVNPMHSKKMQGEHFWKFISKKAMEYILTKKAKIFIDYSMEPYIDKETYEQIHKGLEGSEIPNDCIIMCINSFNAEELYKKYFPESEQKLQVRNLPFCLDHSSWYYNDCILRNNGVCMTENDFYNTKNTIRDNHFLMKIRNAREHRLAILYKMATNDLLKFGDWSFLGNYSTYSPSTISYIIEKYDLNDLHLGKIKHIHDNAPNLLQNERNIDFNKINAWTDETFQPHVNSYFEICFETFIHTDYKSLTEKVFKPIINFQPFIFVAFPGALKLLKELGFKTFDDFIDERYDTEEDNVLRMRMIMDEIDRLCKMNKNEIHDWYWKMEDILVHNHKTLLDYNKTKLFGEDLVKELSNSNNKKHLL
jgi:hypothetical protein